MKILSSLSKKSQTFALLIAVTLLIGLIAAGFIILHHDVASDACKVIDALSTRTTMVREINQEDEKKVLATLSPNYRGEFTPIDVDMFSGPLQPMTIDRNSEWSGANLNYLPLFDGPEIIRINRNLDRALSLNYNGVNPLRKLLLQNEIREITDNLGAEIRNGMREPERQYATELLSKLKILEKNFRLTKRQLTLLKDFEPIEFAKLNNYNGFKCLVELEVKNKPLFHDMASDYRLQTRVFALSEAPIPDEKKLIANGHLHPTERTLFILVMDMSNIDEVGNFDYTNIPFIVRTELVDGYKGDLKPIAFNAYLPSNKDNNYQLREINNNVGGVPLSELPNVANGYRVSLLTSCVGCHGVNQRLAIKTGMVSILQKTHSADKTKLLSARSDLKIETK